MWEFGAVPRRLRNHLTADAGHLHLIEAYGRSASDLRVVIRSAVPDGSNKRCDVSVGGSASQQPAQIVAPGCKQAGVELPIGREPHAGTIAAESLCDRSDDAKFPCPIPIAVPLD